MKKINTLAGFEESYILSLKQPINHNEPDRNYFQQRFYLSHKGFDKPTVVVTHGYDVPWHKQNEICEKLDANLVIIEHRYYGQSKPETTDWKYLTTWQAASDHQQIITLLKKIYKGKWIATGKSKGGMATLFLNYFYPNVVNASIVYVSPIILGIKDRRISNFLDEVGDSASRAKITNFQIACLKNRDLLIRELKKIQSSTNKNYSISADSILEWSVIEFPYMFWSAGKDISTIPNVNSNAKTLFSYLNKVSPISSYSDKYLEYNYPLLHQELTEIGYYNYNAKHIKELLKFVKEPDIKCFASPNDTVLQFNPELMNDIKQNLENQANNIIYLYGENDIWTAASVDPKEATNSLKIIIRNTGHHFSIKNQPIELQNKIFKTLKQWIE